MKSKRANYPKWVEEFRGEGREIKKVGSCYYLYTFKTVYDPMTKKPKKNIYGLSWKDYRRFRVDPGKT